MGGRTRQTLCLSPISLTSILPEFSKDRRSGESVREVTYACYPRAGCHPDPAACQGLVPVAGQGCLGLPGLPCRLMDCFSQLFLEAEVLLLPKPPFL